MKLIDSYLQEVSQFLPAENRDDILVELRASLEEQILDQAQAQGREATTQDESAVLRRLGHPLKAASRYQTQRYLIGPGLYPGFIQTLRVVLAIVLSLQFVLALIAAYSAGWQFSVMTVFGQLLNSAFMTAAIVTAVFVVIEHSGEQLKWYESWQPESLSSGAVGVINRSNVITNLITEGVFLLWWNDALVFQNWIPVLGDQYPLTLSPIWAALHWPLNVLIGMFFVLHAYVLVRGLWQRKTLIAEIVLGVALLGMIATLLVGGDLIATTQADSFPALAALQRSAWTVVLVIAGFVAWDVITALRLMRR